jgi:hypothetical protein
MKTIKKLMSVFTLLTVLVLILSSCASTTMIESTPSGAKVYLDGESVGTTPYWHEDTKISFSKTAVRLELEGYESYNTTITRDEDVDVGAIVGGFFVYIPWLWTMKYKEVHSYELVPLDVAAMENLQEAPMKGMQTKAQKLRELKELLDEKIITQEEFDAEKKKILELEEFK